MKQAILLLVFALPSIVLLSCGKEKIPDDRTTMGLSMDGSQHVMVSGYPDEQSTSRPSDSSLALQGFSTAPLPLAHPLGYAVGTRDGRVFLYSNTDSLTTIIDLHANASVDQLLTRAGGTIVAITIDGAMFGLATNGNVLWRTSLGGTPTANALLVSNFVVVPSTKKLTAFDLTSGAARWNVPLSLDPLTLASTDSIIYAAISYNQAGYTDTVLAVTTQGVVTKRVPITGKRITSNLIAAKLDDEIHLYVGSLSNSGGAVKQSALECYALNGKQVFSHNLPYLVTNIASNEKLVFASGYRSLQSGLVSGIDAFSMSDTTWYWHKDFSEPIGSALAVSQSNIYFTMSFSSEAYVSTRGLFYTLDAADGRIRSERTVNGAANGFFAAIPMVDQEGRFLLVDREKPLIYILDRSSLRRMF